MPGASFSYVLGWLPWNRHCLSSDAAATYGMAGVLHFSPETSRDKNCAGLFWQFNWDEWNLISPLMSLCKERLHINAAGYRLMSFFIWLKIIVRLRIHRGERLTVNSPLLVRTKVKKIVPLTGAYMASMDKIFGPVLGWHNATIHSRRRGFATAVAQNGIHMSYITIAMRHSQGVTMQYIALGMAEKASITTRLAIASYNERRK